MVNLIKFIVEIEMNDSIKATSSMNSIVVIIHFPYLSCYLVGCSGNEVDG